MNPESTMEKLLRWRLARAEEQAPRAPSGALLLKRAQPWWETWPEWFELLVERVGRIETSYGYAMAEPNRPRTGHPVAALIVRGAEPLETFARILYISVRDGRLRLRFQLDAICGQPVESFEVTFINERDARPLLSAQAALSVDSEYRMDTEFSEQLARDWESLKVTDRMPFRWILRAEMDGG